MPMRYMASLYQLSYQPSCQQRFPQKKHFKRYFNDWSLNLLDVWPWCKDNLVDLAIFTISLLKNLLLCCLWYYHGSTANSDYDKLSFITKLSQLFIHYSYFFQAFFKRFFFHMVVLLQCPSGHSVTLQIQILYIWVSCGFKIVWILQF